MGGACVVKYPPRVRKCCAFCSMMTDVPVTINFLHMCRNVIKHVGTTLPKRACPRRDKAATGTLSVLIKTVLHAHCARSPFFAL